MESGCDRYGRTPSSRTHFPTARHLMLADLRTGMRRTGCPSLAVVYWPRPCVVETMPATSSSPLPTPTRWAWPIRRPGDRRAANGRRGERVGRPNEVGPDNGTRSVRWAVNVPADVDLRGYGVSHRRVARAGST